MMTFSWWNIYHYVLKHNSINDIFNEYLPVSRQMPIVGRSKDAKILPRPFTHMLPTN